MKAKLAAIAVLACCAVPALGADSAMLEIASQGYLFAGGKYVDGADGKYMVGQAYVEYQIPKNRTHPYPIVMIEGGGQSGSNFTGTPDGREGWAQYFLKRGYAVYVVDQPGRGRSALRPDYGDTVQRPTSWVQQQFTAPERSKLWPQAKLHTQWPGTGMAGDPIFDQFYAQQLQAIASFPKQQELNRDAGAALLDRIGPAILLTHSQSGAFGWPIADARPKLVKAIVAVEPSGPPVHDVEFKGAPNWFADSPKTKTWGLGEVPLTYDPPGPPEFVRQDVDPTIDTTPNAKNNTGRLFIKLKPRNEHGESANTLIQQLREANTPDLARCWLQQEPARQLVNLKHIPVLIVMSEASYHASYDHCTAHFLAQAGVKNTYVRLADVGIRGNGHMMMLEKNNDAIAGVMADWLAKTLPGKTKTTAAR